MSRLIGYEQNVLTLLNLIKSITRKHNEKLARRIQQQTCVECWTLQLNHHKVRTRWADRRLLYMPLPKATKLSETSKHTGYCF